MNQETFQIYNRSIGSNSKILDTIMKLLYKNVSLHFTDNNNNICVIHDFDVSHDCYFVKSAYFKDGDIHTEWVDIEKNKELSEMFFPCAKIYSIIENKNKLIAEKVFLFFNNKKFKNKNNDNILYISAVVNDDYIYFIGNDRKGGIVHYLSSYELYTYLESCE